VPTLLTHGDELCTDDVAYQRFRSACAQPSLARQDAREPYGCAACIACVPALAQPLRRRHEAEAIMDVNADAVADAFRRHGVTRIVHGPHAPPARHELDGRRQARERHVLAAWHDDGRYLEIDERGVRDAGSTARRS
jgi:UDP-2,3-diacylglucosamine hydrolase